MGLLSVVVRSFCFTSMDFLAFVQRGLFRMKDVSALGRHHSLELNREFAFKAVGFTKDGVTLPLLHKVRVDSLSSFDLVQ